MPEFIFEEEKKPKQLQFIFEAEEPEPPGPSPLALQEFLRTGRPAPEPLDIAPPEVEQPGLGAAFRGIAEAARPVAEPILEAGPRFREPPTEEPLFDELGLPVAEPGFLPRALVAPFEPALRAVRFPTVEAVPEAFEQFAPEEQVEMLTREGASLSDLAGAMARGFLPGFAAGPIPEAPFIQDHGLQPDEAEAVGRVALDLVAMHYYATGVLRITGEALAGAQRMLRSFLVRRGFTMSEAERVAALFADDAAGNAMHRTIMESEFPEEVDAAARAFERKYGWRHPNDPRGKKPRMTRAERRAARKEREAARREREGVPPEEPGPPRELEFVAEEEVPPEVPPEAPPPPPEEPFEITPEVPEPPIEPQVTNAGTPFKTERGATQNIAKVAKQFGVAEADLKVVEIPGGFGIVGREVEVSPPVPPEAPELPPEEPVVPEPPAPPVEPEAPVERPVTPEEPTITDEIAARMELAEETKAPLDVDTIHAEAPVPYQSGVSRIADLRTHVHAAVPVGVSVAELSKNGIKVLTDYAAEGGDIFMDSGAYQGKKPNWPKTFKAYFTVNKAARIPIKAVAPDVIGDQAQSLSLLEKHRSQIVGLMDSGADVIVPLQLGMLEEGRRTGELGPVELLERVREILGRDDFVVGIPSVKGRPAAWTDAEVDEILGMPHFPDAIHFLGAEAGVPRVQRAVGRLGDPGLVSSDSTIFRKELKAISKRQKEIEAELRAEGEEIIPGFARELAITDIMHPHLLSAEDLGEITLVACCKAKAPTARAARNIYKGDLFVKMRDFVETKGGDWAILSAKHGFLDPGKKVAPYDLAITQLKKAEKEKWADKVVDNIIDRVGLVPHVEGRPQFKRITLLAGEQYRKLIQPRLEAEGFDVFVPMRGMAIGKQKAWLKRGVEGPQPVAEAVSPEVQAPLPAYEKFMKGLGYRLASEAKGQAILDELDAAEIGPNEVWETFWRDTFGKLNPQQQKLITNYVNRLSGFKPGDVIAVDRAGNEIKAKNWSELLEFGDDIDALIGGERGLIALMAEANQRVTEIVKPKPPPKVAAPKKPKKKPKAPPKEVSPETPAPTEEGPIEPDIEPTTGKPVTETLEPAEVVKSYQDEEGFIYRVDRIGGKGKDFAIYKTKDKGKLGKRALRGIVTKRIKISPDPAKIQATLDAFANERGWKEVPGARVSLEKPTETIEEKPVFVSTADTPAKMKKETTTWVDDTIRGMEKNQIEEGGWVKLLLGPTEFNIMYNIGALKGFRKGLAALTRQVSTAPKGYRVPKQPKLGPALARYAPRKMDYVPITKTPKGKPKLWSNGHLIDKGDRPPKGAKVPEVKVPIEYEKVEELFKEAEVHANKANRKAVKARWQINEETGKPNRFGSLVNKAGEEIGVNPEYIAYFQKKYPDAEFYFKPESEVKKDSVPVRNEKGEIERYEEKERKRFFGDVAVVSKGKYVGMIKSIGDVPLLQLKRNEAGELQGYEFGEAEFLENPKEKGTQPPYKKSYGYASAGTYATGAEQHAAPLQNVISMPEMVEMARQLMGGRFPGIVKYIDRQGAVQGRFWAAGLGRMVIRADLFRDLAQALAVLAHEIGHLVDFVPQLTMRRGNILGRIAKFAGVYRKHILPRMPGARADLTEADRRRIRRQAEKIIREEYKDKWIDEVIEKTMPITPQDILNIWNAVEAAQMLSPELLQFVAELSGVEKKAIVKEALKGAVPLQLARFAKKVKVPTGKKVKAEIPKDAIAQKYAELINEEIEKLRLFKMEEIMDELKALSRAWKPFDPMADASFTRYRYSSPELYADAISVLFNAPGLLKSMAPNFYEGFFNYLEENPEVKRLYDGIQADIASGVSRKKLRQRIYDDFRSGDDAYGQQLEDRPKGALFGKRDLFMREIIDQHWAIIKPVKRWIKQGLDLPPEKNPRFAVENMIMSGSEAEWLITRTHHFVIKPLEEMGLSWDDFGYYRLLKRVIAEPEMAATRGMTIKEAQEEWEDLKANEWSGPRWETLESVSEQWDKTRSELIEKIEASGRYNKEIIEIMKERVGDYATFDVVKYIEERNGIAPTAGIFPRLGSFEPISNPATATILKDIAMLKAANRTKLAENVVNFMFKYQKQFPEQGTQIVPAKRRWNGRFQEIMEPPRGSGQGLIVFLKNGKARGYYVDKFLAEAFERNPVESWMMAKALNWLAFPFKQIFTELNPGFWLYNTLFRDLLRGAQMLPKANLSKMIRAWTKAIKPGFRSTYGIPDDVVEEMTKNNMLISIEGARGLSKQDREIERMLARFKITPLKWNQKIIRPLAQIINFYANIGRAGERAGKIASYIYLKEQFPDMPIDEMRHLVMTRGGSPAFLRLGRAYPIYNNLLMFSNAWKEGNRGDFEAMMDSPWQFWEKKFRYIILPRLLMYAASIGLMGAGVQRVMQGVSKFDKANYIVFPLGLTPQGKSVYIRVPTDEGGRLVGGVLTKLLERDKADNVTNLLDYMAGQAPTTNPAISATIDVLQYATGHNPYDTFRGRYAIPEQIFRARDEHTHRAFVKWLANKYGSNIIMRFKTDEIEGIKTELEELLDTPVLSNILGRFIKVSDVGRIQEIKLERELVKRTNARKILAAKDAIRNWLNNDILTEADVQALAEKPDTFDRNFLKMLARKHGNAVAEELWSVYQTGTAEEKMAVWRKIAELNAVDIPGEGWRFIWQRDKDTSDKKEWTFEEVAPDARPRR